MTRYDAHPAHPLRGVPQKTLDAARYELRDAIAWGDVTVDEEMVDPVADAILIAAVGSGGLTVQSRRPYLLAVISWTAAICAIAVIMTITGWALFDAMGRMCP